MWRTALLVAVVLVIVPAARGQKPSTFRQSFPAGAGIAMPRPDNTGLTTAPLMPALPSMSMPPGYFSQPGLGLPGTPPSFTGMGPSPGLAGQTTTPGNSTFPGLPGALTMPAPPVPVVPGPGQSAENLLTFDTDQVELQWKDNRWQLVSGGVMLKDFGRYETEGREALRIVRELRLNALGTVGSPRPVMEFWLSNGAAPRERVAGLRVIPMDTASLRVEQVQGQWCLRDNNRILFNFGQQADAARQALAAVQRHGFTQVGYVGQVAPVMLVFLAGNPSPATAKAPSTRFSDRIFPRLGGQARPQPKTTEFPSTASPAEPGRMPAVPSQPLAPSPLRPSNAVTPVGLSGQLQPADPGERLRFDPQQLHVRHNGVDWQLLAGNQLLADFGPSRADAELALAALRRFRCNEQVLVGRPQPIFSYFLTDGQAPQGSMLGLHAASFRPESLAVRQMGSAYVVADGDRPLLSFADRGAEAQQMLQAIQHYRFDHLCHIGRGNRGMVLFLRGR